MLAHSCPALCAGLTLDGCNVVCVRVSVVLRCVQAERLADMTDLERNFEKANARLAQLEEEKEAADGQLAELSAQVASLTADLAAASDEAAMYKQDLDLSNVRCTIGLYWQKSQ